MIIMKIKRLRQLVSVNVAPVLLMHCLLSVASFICYLGNTKPFEMLMFKCSSVKGECVYLENFCLCPMI